MRDVAIQVPPNAPTVIIQKVSNGWIVSVPGTTDIYVFSEWGKLGAFLYQLLFSES